MYFAIFGDKVERKISPLIGKTAPDFTINTYDGKNLSLKDLRGKNVVINFWSSWCIPCKKEAIALEDANLRYKDNGIVFIGVNVWDDYDNAVNFLTNYRSSYANGYDPENEVQIDYGVEGVPETFFINSTGIVTNKYSGELTDNIISHFIAKF